VGFAVAYPINWWLVARGLKHGMMTIRPSAAPMPAMAGDMQGMHDMPMEAGTTHGGMTQGGVTQGDMTMSHEAGGSTTAAQRLAFAAGTFLLLAIALVISFRLS
jgi:manganese oxidase